MSVIRYVFRGTSKLIKEEGVLFTLRRLWCRLRAHRGKGIEVYADWGGDPSYECKGCYEDLG